ncbi:MAG: GNAT family N-acetyltransferase [Pseudomonadota bacterium]
MNSVASEHEGAACSVLSEAFQDDPVMRWICAKPDFVLALFTLLVPLYCRQGLAFIDDEQSGASLWMPPGRQAQLKLASVPHALRFLSLCGLKGIRRIGQFSRASQRSKPSVPFYYLFTIGVTKSVKGKGVGSKIMKHTLKLCDDTCTPAYLENSRFENLGFYQKHGFEVTEETKLGTRGPTIWLMVRQPQTADR